MGILALLAMRMRRADGSGMVAVAAACLLLSLAAVVTMTARGQERPGAPRVNFSREIRPILANNCFTCHGPDAAHRETEFHFDTQEGAFAEAGIIVPGNAANSVLIQRITHADPKKRMPPVDSGHALTGQQIELLRRWIDEGAAWDMHWSFVPPARPELPAVGDAGWVRNPVDRFILARLEREGLKPSIEADKTTLLRRVTYDLTGLPPTPADVDAFLADRAPDAYEKRVDTLLRSPQYGERLAMPWLDAARYADTHGFHIDSLRGMWPWRDWVIGAFNRNLPFDQFTIEQLAGDLLPNATRDQVVASGFNRNHMINFEGGAIAEEYQVEYVMDRVEATSSTFMGLTMGCARCHSHKFDPLSHKEFYQFFAFFNNVPERGLDGRTGNAAPVLALPSPAQQSESRRARCRHPDCVRCRRRCGRRAAPGSVGEVSVREGRSARRDREAPGALRTGQQPLGQLRPVPTGPHRGWRSDVRRRPDRPGGLLRWRHRGELRQHRRLRPLGPVQSGLLVEGTRQSPNGGVTEAGRQHCSGAWGATVPARLRVGAGRRGARRNPEVGRPPDHYSRVRHARQRHRRFARASV